MAKANLDIRERAKVAGVYLWQIAAAIGVSISTFNIRMRVEMPAKEKEQIFKAINSIESEQKSTSC